MNRETFTVWISKYALTNGILEIQARITGSKDMIVDSKNNLHYFYKPY